MRVVGWAFAGVLLVAAWAAFVRADEPQEPRRKPDTRQTPAKPSTLPRGTVPYRPGVPGAPGGPAGSPAYRPSSPAGSPAYRPSTPGGSPAYRPSSPAFAPRSPAGPGGAPHFADRVKSGQLDALSRGPVGQKIQLSQQYRMAQQGDVARRMNLYQNARRPYAVYNNVHSPEFRRQVDIGYFPYHGVVSVSFGVGSIHGYYAGPGFYPQ